MFRQITILFMFMAFCLTTTVAMGQNVGSDSKLQAVFDQYSKGDYEGAILELEKISPSDQKQQGLIEYWKGLSYSKISDFENATKFLRLAIELGFESPDIYYEYGQAL